MIRSIIENKKKEKQREENLKTLKNIAIGASIGSAIGVTVGILVAPKSGKETRNEISGATEDTIKTIKNSLNESAKSTEKWKNDISSNIEKSVEELKYILEKKDQTIDENDKEEAIETRAEEIE